MYGISHVYGQEVKEEDAALEPECSHIEHFWKTRHVNSLGHVSGVTIYHCTVGCGMSKKVECQAWNVECKV